MTINRWMRGMLLGATTLAASPAYADAAREAKLEARLNVLEAAIFDMRAELAAAHRQQVAAIPTSIAAVAMPHAADPARISPAIPTLPATDGFRVGATTVKINGYFKLTAIGSRYSDGAVPTTSLGRDFYLPGTIPIGGLRRGQTFEASAKQTRISLSTATPIGSHLLKGYLELDFQTSPGAQGSERTTNGYNPALRRGFITYDNFLFGQDWTNFQYVAALPESTDYVGPTEGTVFARQPQIRYTRAVSNKLVISVSVENPKTASATLLAPALIDNGNDNLPDVTARLTYTSPVVELSLAAIGRKLTVDNGVNRASSAGFGASFAGKLPFGPDKRHDLRFMISGGDGIGRYIGLNFAPDTVYAGLPNSKLGNVRAIAGFAALRLGWTASLRSTFVGSFQKVDYASGFVPIGANASAWSASANLFYSPVKNFDLGFELRHGERTLVTGAKGLLDRGEFAAKYSF